MDIRYKIKRNLKFIRRIFLKNKNFTIISNNCWGGIIYKFFGMCYQSPTVGLSIPPNDFNRFCRNIEHYKNIQITELSIESSKNRDLFSELEKIHGRLILGKCDDVEICFIHYKTFEEATQKWYRRMQRINPNNIIYKNNDNNYMNESQLKEWCEIVKNKNSIFITCNFQLYEIAKCKYKIFYDNKIKNLNWVDDTTKFIKDYSVTKIMNTIQSIDRSN